MAEDVAYNLGLYYHNQSFRGPGKVALNLLKGFAEMEEDIQVISNPDQRSLFDIQHVGVLQPLMDASKYSILPKDSLMGPNLFVVPSEMETLCKSHSHFIVPSEWVKNVYRNYECMKNKQIDVWPVGIDTQEWKPFNELTAEEQSKYSGLKPLDCFIYYKNRSPEDLNVVRNLLKKFNLKYELIEYGKYQEDQLKALCYRSSFCVALDNTESQGIALMEIMSTNIPCFVFDFPKWTAPDTGIEYKATTVPYFNTTYCGMVSVGISQVLFNTFLQSRTTFQPRKYILENHSLKQSSKRYLDLLLSTKKR